MVLHFNRFGVYPMGMPAKVRAAYDRGDHEALRRMRAKAAITRAVNRERNQKREEKRRDELLSAEDWYREQAELKALEADPALLRRDDLLPDDDDLPF